MSDYVLATDRPASGDDTLTHCKGCLRAVFLPLSYVLSRGMGQDKRPILCCDCAEVSTLVDAEKAKRAEGL